MTSEEVARRAAETSHRVQAQVEATAAARAELHQSRASLLPRLSGLARYTRLSSIAATSLGDVVAPGPGTPPGPLAAGTPLATVPLRFPIIQNQYTFQATLEVPLSDYLLRFPQLLEAARDNLRAAALLERATRLGKAAEARVSYFEWARARLQTDVAGRSLAQAEGHLKDVRAGLAAGAASKADVLRVESQVASAELQLARSRSAAVIAEQRLRSAMHDASGRSYEIGDDLRWPPAPRGPSVDARSETGLVEEALAARLEPKTLAAAAAAAFSQAGVVRAAGLPRLVGVANAVDGRPNSRIFPPQDAFHGTWDATVQLSWSPTDLFGSEAGRSGTLAKARALEAERDELADAIALEVTQNLQAAREADAALTTSARGLVSAEESYRVRRALFLNGRATSVELTDAETERSRAQLEAIDAAIDRHLAEARLTHALGRDVDGPH